MNSGEAIRIFLPIRYAVLVSLSEEAFSHVSVLVRLKLPCIGIGEI